MADLVQPYTGIVLFNLVVAGRTYEIAIDYWDYPEKLNDECAARCFIYFKLQHLGGGYGKANVLPGGYVTDSWKLYAYLPSLRRLRSKRDFCFDVYGRFGSENASKIRRAAIDILGAQDHFAFEGGLVKVGYHTFLRDIARSKVCIDLPGLGPFCHRLINYLAIGACVVGPRPPTTLPVPLQAGRDIVYVKDDCSDLVETCDFYLQNDKVREEIATNAQRYFDKYLHVANLAKYYLRSCLERIC